MSEQQIWMRSIKFHSYHNVLREPDTFYQVDSPEDVDTILAHHLGVLESPPPRARREVVPSPNDVPGPARVAPLRTTEARVMTPRDVVAAHSSDHVTPTRPKTEWRPGMVEKPEPDAVIAPDLAVAVAAPAPIEAPVADAAVAPAPTAREELHERPQRALKPPVKRQ